MGYVLEKVEETVWQFYFAEKVVKSYFQISLLYYTG